MESKLKQKLINCLRDYFEANLIAVVLFGSRARGEAKSVSDYDLFLVAHNLPKRFLER
ncbi:MAG: nucleotidyltransferase domain-containing protein [bacterium]